jgi:hypothetical protein
MQVFTYKCFQYKIDVVDGVHIDNITVVSRRVPLWREGSGDQVQNRHVPVQERKMIVFDRSQRSIELEVVAFVVFQQVHLVQLTLDLREPHEPATWRLGSTRKQIKKNTIVACFRSYLKRSGSSPQSDLARSERRFCPVG